MMSVLIIYPARIPLGLTWPILFHMCFGILVKVILIGLTFVACSPRVLCLFGPLSLFLHFSLPLLQSPFFCTPLVSEPSVGCPSFLELSSPMSPMDNKGHWEQSRVLVRRASSIDRTSGAPIWPTVVCVPCQIWRMATLISFIRLGDNLSCRRIRWDFKSCAISPHVWRALKEE